LILFALYSVAFTTIKKAKMEDRSEHIREQQKEAWNKFSPGWKKWDELNMDFLKPMGDEIINVILPHGNEIILDVAAGTGEPGLTIATRLNGGKVIITDLSEGMLDVARENAAKRGITNIETVACDVCALPFADNTFDSISCRLGFMFFPDMLLAAKEMFRVLKPGGKIATTVWSSPDKNFWVSIFLNVLNNNMELPKTPAGAPGLYRCAAPGLVAGLLHKAGFKHITESEVTGTLNADRIDVYWIFMTEVVSVVVTALSKADNVIKAKIKSEVYESVKEKYPSGTLAFDSCGQIVAGVK
jgi:ubiquinone/menaquinone biosynthesis C-methylase UbiE